MNDIDILDIDSTIRKRFAEEKSKLNHYIEMLKSTEQSMNVANISSKTLAQLKETKQYLIDHIEDIQSDMSLNFYISETSILLENYKKILNSPLKMTFIGKPTKNTKAKTAIIREFVDIANKYSANIVLPPSKKSQLATDVITCSNCSNKKNFDVSDSMYICCDCSCQHPVLKNVTSFKDIDRVNVTSKYKYDRKTHFRDTINQYQGKQNSSVEQEVYDQLEKQLELHHLLVEPIGNDPKTRFRNITKEHINMFLKELNHTKHYENINLIHYHMTGNKPDDISHLEEKLLEDFDALTEVYDKIFKTIDRKNFINAQYLLARLLVRHKHPFNEDDFTVLKTIDRKTFHDDVFREICNNLEWKYHSGM